MRRREVLKNRLVRKFVKEHKLGWPHGLLGSQSQEQFERDLENLIMMCLERHDRDRKLEKQWRLRALEKSQEDEAPPQFRAHNYNIRPSHRRNKFGFINPRRRE
jgi:hypothetical protein